MVFTVLNLQGKKGSTDDRINDESYNDVKTRFRYLVAKYFFSIFKKAGFNMALMGEVSVPNHVNDTLRPWVLVLKIFHVCKICRSSSLLIEEKRKNILSLAIKKLLTF
jgi:hypothetical protein